MYRTLQIPQRRLIYSQCFQASLISIKQETPSVKLFEFQVKPPSDEFKFQPGQWIELGFGSHRTRFSIASSPSKLSKSFEIAVKDAYSNPIVKHLHSPDRRAGDVLSARVGGSFWYRAPDSAAFVNGENIEYLLLIAGGVGISPLMSILEVLVADSRASMRRRKVTLLYSVHDEEDIVFRSRLVELCQSLSENQNLQLTVRIYVTRYKSKKAMPQDYSTSFESFYGCYITSRVFSEYLITNGDTDLRHTSVYLCGPSSLEDSVCDSLKKLEFDMRKVHRDTCKGRVLRHSAVAVSHQTARIVAVGDSASIRALAPNSATIVDARGKLLVPGFIDSHVHFLMGGARLSNVQLAGCKSSNEFTDRIAAYVSRVSPGEWIYGGDWDNTLWSDAATTPATLLLIDAVTPNNPVWVNRSEGHQYLANSLALSIAGVSAATPDVPGGTIHRFADGSPTGLLTDNALKLVYPYVAKMTTAQNRAAVDAATRYAHAYGVTSIHHMTEPEDRNRAGVANDLEVFDDIENAGLLKMRIYCAVPIQLWKTLESRKNRQGRCVDPNRLVRWGAVKGYCDGSLGSHTACFIEPYAGRADGYRDDMVNSEEQLYTWIKEIDFAGYQVFIHSIGDYANRVILNVFERVYTENPPRDRRNRVEHPQHIDTKADLSRFQKLGIHCSMQPKHAVDDGRWCAQIIGTERTEHGTYAFKSLMETGVNVAFGSDWFVTAPNPIRGIAAAVTRRMTELDDTRESRKNYDQRPIFTGHERISVNQALMGYTYNAAKSVHEEAIKGCIEVGYLADMCLLDMDILTCHEDEIEEARVVMTVFGGEVVYDYFGELKDAMGETEIDRINRATRKHGKCPCC